MAVDGTTALQGRLLGLLVDGRVWSRDELAEALAREVQGLLELGPDEVVEALDALVEGGLVHQVSDELVSASRRGMAAREGVEAGDGLELRVPDSSGIGVTRLNVPDAGDRIVGGAETLPTGLDVVSGAGAAD